MFVVYPSPLRLGRSFLPLNHIGGDFTERELLRFFVNYIHWGAFLSPSFFITIPSPPCEKRMHLQRQAQLPQSARFIQRYISLQDRTITSIRWRPIGISNAYHFNYSRQWSVNITIITVKYFQKQNIPPMRPHSHNTMCSIPIWRLGLFISRPTWIYQVHIFVYSQEYS